jgi:hypothetical protein
MLEGYLLMPKIVTLLTDTQVKNAKPKDKACMLDLPASF